MSLRICKGCQRLEGLIHNHLCPQFRVPKPGERGANVIEYKQTYEVSK